MSGTCSIDQYEDMDDPYHRWIAEVSYGAENVQTFALPSEEAALVECYRWAARLGWKIDDSDFWWGFYQRDRERADALSEKIEAACSPWKTLTGPELG